MEQAQNKIIQKLQLQLLVSLLVTQSVGYLFDSFITHLLSQMINYLVG
jgi:hypothetical protein